MTLLQNGYEIVKDVISEDLLNNLAIQFKMTKNVYEFLNKEKNTTTDNSQCDNSFNFYSPLCFEALSLQLKPKIEMITKKKLFPTYTYARIYYNGSYLKPHRDILTCEYSVTICIKTTHLWDFHIKDERGRENIIKLKPGDMCVYLGCKLEHWREKYEGDQNIQCFLHYVDSEGSYNNLKYDMRPMMGINSTFKKKYGYMYT